MVERSKAPDCKSGRYTFEGSNPSFPTIMDINRYKMQLTREEAEYLFENHKGIIKNYIKYENLIYFRTTEDLKYDPLNFEDSLKGIVKF